MNPLHEIQEVLKYEQRKEEQLKRELIKCKKVQTQLKNEIKQIERQKK